MNRMVTERPPGRRKPRTSEGARDPRGRRERKAADIDKLVAMSASAFEVFHSPEPELVFGQGRIAVDPKDGLEQYGPAGVRPGSIRMGVIGTGRSTEQFLNYLEKVKLGVSPGRNRRNLLYDSLAFPDFPGITQDKGFRVPFETGGSLLRSIREAQLMSAITGGSLSDKMRAVSDLVMEQIQVLSEQDPEPDVVIVALPDEVEKQLGQTGKHFGKQRLVLSPSRKLIDKLEKQKSKTGQDFLPLVFEDREPQLGGYWNLHHALKARAMEVGIPTQLVWESVLRGEGLTQDPASMAWNLFTAIYYKSGNIPWELRNIPERTCFVGVSFYKDSPHKNADTHSSLAQVFSGAGDGLVLKGQKAVVDESRGDRKAHLDAKGAEHILKEAIELYKNHHDDQEPARVVLHKSSRYWPEELEGFKSAVGRLRYDFLTLERTGTRFMRLGAEPPIRGTVIQLAKRHYLVFTVGFVPFLGLYPGMRIPVPIEILEHHGEATARQVCEEILALTKVNWNSCAFASSEPMTLQFARSVGRILTEIREGPPKQTKYKFYM